MSTALTLKRVGIYFNPILLLDTRDYWGPLLRFLDEQVIGERFLNPQHRAMWSLVTAPELVLPAIRAAPPWDRNAREFAAVRPDN